MVNNKFIENYSFPFSGPTSPSRSYLHRQKCTWKGTFPTFAVWKWWFNGQYLCIAFHIQLAINYTSSSCCLDDFLTIGDFLVSWEWQSRKGDLILGNLLNICGTNSDHHKGLVEFLTIKSWSWVLPDVAGRVNCGPEVSCIVITAPKAALALRALPSGRCFSLAPWVRWSAKGLLKPCYQEN